MSLLPLDSRTLAAETGPLKRQRKGKSVERLLRALLLHLGCGHSVPETTARARQAGVAELTPMAVWNRLKKSHGRPRAHCTDLFRQKGADADGAANRTFRTLDAVKESGPPGSRRRVHCRVLLQALNRDFLRFTEKQGAFTG